MEQRNETQPLEIDIIRERVKKRDRLTVIAGGLVLEDVSSPQEGKQSRTYEVAPTYPNDRDWAHMNLTS